MAEILLAIAGVCAVSTKINEFVVTTRNQFRNQFRYLFRHNDFIQELKVEVEKLDNETTSLQGRIDAALRNLEFIRGGVKTWISIATTTKDEADAILGAAAEVQNGTCLSGTCSNLKSRYSSGKQAKKMTEVVRQLRVEWRKFKEVSVPALPIGTETIPPSTSGTFVFETQQHKLEDIMACLRDDAILVIGICGMGGVGKTTMANEIVKRASEEKLFDEIVKVVVSHQVDMLKIQQQIAGLRLEGKNYGPAVITNRLHYRLSTNRVLLFLDDVWERLHLEELGIPARCKIILTSRNQNVCKKMITKEDAGKIFSLDCLSAGESWALFREKSGSVVDEPYLHPLAVDVAKECKGLPLALVIVGNAMRYKTNRADWEDALRQLRRGAPTNISGVI